MCLIALQKGVSKRLKGHLLHVKRALIGSQLTPFLFSVYDFYLHYIRSHRSKTLLYYDSFDSFVTYLHLPCYPIYTYLVTALLLTLLPCLLLLCLLLFVNNTPVVIIIMNYWLWILNYSSMNCELILVFGGHEKSLENLLLSISKLWSCGCRTRTCDLQVMSLASYQLLQPAILNNQNNP